MKDQGGMIQALTHRCSDCGQAVDVQAESAYEFAFVCRCGAKVISWSHEHEPPTFQGQPALPFGEE